METEQLSVYLDKIMRGSFSSNLIHVTWIKLEKVMNLCYSMCLGHEILFNKDNGFLLLSYFTVRVTIND